MSVNCDKFGPESGKVREPCDAGFFEIPISRAKLIFVNIMPNESAPRRELVQSPMNIEGVQNPQILKVYQLQPLEVS